MYLLSRWKCELFSRNNFGLKMAYYVKATDITGKTKTYNISKKDYDSGLSAEELFHIYSTPILMIDRMINNED